MLIRFLAFGLLCLFATQASADNAELRRLQSILATLNQQLEATYHQFQMVQEARRDVLQTLYSPRPGLDPRSYDELMQDQAQAMQQQKDLTQQMNELLAKAREIEAQMNPVLDRIYQLIPNAENTETPPAPIRPNEPPATPYAKPAAPSMPPSP
jgi:DNA anti-recombination protein RmuC